MEAFVVAVLHTDVQDGGYATSIIGRHAALYQFDVLHGIRIEHAEESEEVTGVIYGGLIQ
jgi:hypothetical protein